MQQAHENIKIKFKFSKGKNKWGGGEMTSNWRTECIDWQLTSMAIISDKPNKSLAPPATYHEHQIYKNIHI